MSVIPPADVRTLGFQARKWRLFNSLAAGNFHSDIHMAWSEAELAHMAPEKLDTASALYLERR